MTRIRPPLHLLPPDAYPVDPWRLVESRFTPELLGRTETLFAVANGYLGLRGTHEEGRPAAQHGTLVAGFHETWPIEYAETAYGLAKTGQTIVDVPDPSTIALAVDDEPLFLPTAHLRSYERSLDFRAGLLERRLLWETPAGKQVQVVSRRMVSLEHRHLAVMTYEVTVLNADAPVVLTSRLLNRQDQRSRTEGTGETDPRKGKVFDHRVLVDGLRSAVDQRIVLGYTVANSRMTLGCGVDHLVTTEADHTWRTDVDDDGGDVTLMVDARAGQTVRLVKYASYHVSRSVEPGELTDRAEQVLDRAKRKGTGTLSASQRHLLDAFWDRADVEVDGDPQVQQAVRWNLFMLAQAAIRAEGTGIPAKGLTGHGYEGQYFWDIEMYMHPFLVHALPRVASNLLRFRHSMLPDARARARELGQDGALFPWRTIDGQEASAYYQAGTAQYHLNADVAHAVTRYVDLTGDSDLLDEAGAEILVETARLWEDLGFHGDDDAFHLHSVTGPDEYTTVVNDNAFTNLMARRNLRTAAELLERLAEERPEHFAMLAEHVRLQGDEPARWRRAADHMFVPYNERRGIIPQDAHFLEREVWDFANTPAENYPLLLHYHPLVIYRFQVLKQADVVLAMFVLGDEFSLEEKRRNLAYYEPLTTGDSSLSPPAQSIVAAEVGAATPAMEHFRHALFMDLGDVAGNADDGVHVASAGGVWMALAYGFGGLRDHRGRLSFDPRLPAAWSRLSYRASCQGRLVRADVTHEALTLTLLEGEPLEVHVRRRPVTLTPDTPATIALTPPATL